MRKSNFKPPSKSLQRIRFRALLSLALYRSEGKGELAEKVLTEAKLQLSSDPNAYRLLGDYYVSQGDTSRALTEFASLTQEHPKDLNVRKSYVQLLILSWTAFQKRQNRLTNSCKTPRRMQKH